MAVDRADLLVYIGSEADGDVQDALLDRILAAAEDMVDNYAASGTPGAVRDQAVRQVGALLWYHRGGIGADGRVRRANALADSGARAVLRPYKTPKLGRASA